MEFKITKKAKTVTTALLAGGGLLAVIGAIYEMNVHSEGFVQRLMANLLTNSFFFFAIGLGALFFLALQYATETGWYASVKRLIEALAGWLPWGIAMLALTLGLITVFKGAHIYLWMDPEVVAGDAGQRGEVIQSIRVRDELGVSHVLRDLFVAAMQVADVGHRLGDDLAVHLQQDAQHAVRGRMRRPHVEDHLLAFHVAQFARSRSFRRTRRRFAKLNVLNGCHSQKISDQHHHYYAGRSQNCRDRQNHTHATALAGRSCCKLLRLFRVKFGG